MSVLDARPPRVVGGPAPAGPALDLLPGKDVTLGSTAVRRLLPALGRRMIGAWCFVDHYGPDEIADEPGMQVPPHPHTGLQTVSWLLDGEVRHRDSLGSDTVLRPGELGLMTAGRGIAHAEQSPARHPAQLHGAQLWVALPDAARHRAPAFAHHTDLPVVTAPGVRATVLLGEVDGARSPGETHTPIVGADLALAGGAAAVPLQPDFEHALIVASGAVTVDGVVVGPGSLLHLGTGRTALPLHTDAPARALLLGGEPFAERLVMWWNFVGRTGEEIARYREQWAAGDVFGTVPGDATPLPAPALPPVPLKARGRVR